MLLLFNSVLLSSLLIFSTAYPLTSQEDASLNGCPSWLGPACDPVCIAKNCAPSFQKCWDRKPCRNNFFHSLECMATHSATNFTAQTACMVPDMPDRDELYHCIIEQHRCIKLPQNGPKYPVCRDTSIVPGPRGIPADEDSKLTDFTGVWYKIHSWKLGEPIECMDCQRLEFSMAGKDAVVFNSTWNEPDIYGVMHNMNVVAEMYNDHARGPGRLFNTGVMFGLTYWEPYTIVKDGSKEKEPFLFFYVCGGTLQGNYTTAFTVGRSPHLTSTLKARLAVEIAKVGLSDSDFCDVNNTCFH